MILSSTVAGPVRETRRNQGLTQVELARRAGVSRQTVLRLENGGDASITLDKLERILSVLGLSLTVAPADTGVGAGLRPLPAYGANSRGPSSADQDERISDEILQQTRLGHVLVDGNVDYKRIAEGWEVE